MERFRVYAWSLSRFFKCIGECEYLLLIMGGSAVVWL